MLAPHGSAPGNRATADRRGPYADSRRSVHLSVGPTPGARLRCSHLAPWRTDRASSGNVGSMTDYQPAWRRPIAQVFRRTAHAAVQWCVRLGIHPNLVSYSSIG